jgi:hypothetical protein
MTAENLSLIAQIERSLPGVRCHSVEYRYWGEWDDADLDVALGGSAEDLIRNDVLTMSMIDLLPPCGLRQWGQSKVGAFRIPGCWTTVSRRKRGGFRVNLFANHDRQPALSKRLGIRPPPRSEPIVEVPRRSVSDLYDAAERLMPDRVLAVQAALSAAMGLQRSMLEDVEQLLERARRKHSGARVLRLVVDNDRGIQPA